MNKKLKITKGIFAIFLIFLLNINVMAAVISDNDGSAFITKAEFDALKKSFNEQIDSYNQSIDNKIDGVIASYLTGISISSNMELYTDELASYTFVNNINNGEQREDGGVYNFNTQRISVGNGLIGINGGASGTYYSAPNRYLLLEIAGAATKPEVPAQLPWTDILVSLSWTDTLGAMNTSEDRKKCYIDIGTSAVLGVDPSLINLAWYKNNILKELAAGNDIFNLNFDATWAMGTPLFINKFIKSGQNITFYCCIYNSGTKTYNRTGYTITGGHTPTVSATPDVGIHNAVNSKAFKANDVNGIGFGTNTRNGTMFLNKFYKNITVMNSFSTQQYSYKDISDDTSLHSANAWNDETLQDIVITPDMDWNYQEDGTNQPLDHTGTTNSTFWSFQGSKLQVPDSTVWSDYYQLGTNMHFTTVKTFDENCPIQYSDDQTITNDQTEFNRTGYYLESDGTLQTKTDNIVKSGTITYKKLQWQSADYDADQLAIQSISNMSGETTYLGGGIPLAYSPSEMNDIKVKVDYKVTKEDGTDITSSDGNIDIKIELSNKQFKNGAVDPVAFPGAVSKGTFTKTVNDTSATGTWTSDAFSMEAKSKVWLNAYAVQKGYNVVIKNIIVK